MKNLVMLDLGSNSTRMSINQVDDKGNFTEVKRMKQMTRMAENAFTSFLLGIESMIKGMNPVYPAVIYAIVSISLCLLVMKRFKLRFE